MKSIIYKNPVKSIVIINLLTMFLSAYIIKSELTPVIMAMPLVGILDKKIMDKGINMTNKKKVFIVVSFVVMASILLFYIFNMKISKFANA